MIAVLAAVAVGLVSAFLPLTPVEPYLLAAAATTGAPPVALGVAAAVGQTAGKVAIFLGARGVFRRLPVRRKTPRLVQVLDRPGQATGMLLLSAVTGIPPLLAASVYLGRSPMRLLTFAATCLLGRTARFTTVAYAPHLL